MIRSLFLFLICSLILEFIDGSYGDLDYNFVRCSQNLFREWCSKAVSSTPLRLLSNSIVPWTCAEACEYECMSNITSERVRRKLNIYKYYGHWPFIRYWGVEEIASVIFSILNGISHFCFAVQYLYRFAIWKSIGETQTCSFMYNWIFFYSLSAIMAWAMSAIYHSKKTSESTKWDLIFALGVIISGLMLVIRKLLGPKVSIMVTYSLIIATAALFAFRAQGIYDGNVSFDSHMKSCIILFTVTSVLWSYWAGFVGRKSLFSRFSWPSFQSPRWLCLLCNAWLLAAALLELFDFPPILGIFDAHSLWHAATVPLGPLWYRFWTLEMAAEADPDEDVTPIAYDIDKKEI